MKRFLVALISLCFIPLCAYATPTVFISTNLSGNASVKSALASQSLLLDIEKVSDDKVVAVGEYGHILTSSDGEQWQQANVPVQTTLTSVTFYNEQLGWAVGHDATILHTTDGGNNWQVQHFQPELEKPLLDVLFKSPLEGVAIGAYGLVLRTLDGGQSWQNEFHQEFLSPDDKDYLNELKVEDETAYLDEISYILPHFNRLVADGRTLFLLGEVGLLAKSNDFGLTWQRFDEIYRGSFFDLGRTKAGNLLVVGLRGNIFRGIQNGAQWQQVTSGTTALLNDIVFGDNADMFILGNNGTVLMSLDDGENFSSRIQSDGKALIAGVWFKNKLIAVSEVGVKTLKLPSK
ncbi:YCF48-related protein [Colwellia asteriadis]|uniref:YCF48-related protein n=1 Tax=Colwellia asteriadis TaxID=517723 RepID=A0ABP3WI76_9GAMM